MGKQCICAKKAHKLWYVKIRMPASAESDELMGPPDPGGPFAFGGPNNSLDSALEGLLYFISPL